MEKSGLRGFFKNACTKIAGSFKALFNHIKNSKLTTLVVMQLKDKWNFSFKANKKETILKLIVYVIFFAVLCAASYFVLSLSISLLRIFTTSVIPVNFMVVVIFLLTLIEGLSILISLTNDLYFAKDNAILITYPVTSSYLFISKVIVYFFDSIKKAFTLFIPVLIGFGIVNAMPAYYYFWIILCVLIYMAVLTLLCALLSIPTYYVMRFFERFSVIKYIVATAALGLIIFVVVELIGLIPEDINIIKNFYKVAGSFNGFLANFSNSFKVFAAIGACFCGIRKGFEFSLFSNYSWIVMLGMIGAEALLIFGNMMIAKPFYNKMISGRGNFKIKKKLFSINVRRPQGLSVIYYEFLRIIRNEKLVVSSIISIVVCPLLILLVNKFYASFDTRQFGDTLIILFNFLFINVIACSHNTTSSYIFSKDGPSWNINKTIPIDPKVSLPARLIYNIAVSFIIVIPASIIFFSFGRADFYNVYGEIVVGRTIIEKIFFIITEITLVIFHSVLSASYDFMHSETKTKADIGAEYIKTHEAMGILFAVLCSLAVFGVGLLMSATNTPYVFVRIGIISILVAALEIYLFFKRIKATYQEN